MGKPRDGKDAALEMARNPADIAGQLTSLKGEARAWFSDPTYSTLKLRLESAHLAVEAAVVEARRRVRLNQGLRALDWEYAGILNKDFGAFPFQAVQFINPLPGRCQAQAYSRTQINPG